MVRAKGIWMLLEKGIETWSFILAVHYTQK